MGERMPERAMEAFALVEHDEDRAFAIIALIVCAMSGFVMGLLVQGGVAQSLMTAVMIALAAWVGWWLRGGAVMGRPITAGPNPAPSSLLRQGDRGADASGAALRPGAARRTGFALHAPTGRPRTALAWPTFKRSPWAAGRPTPTRV